MKKVSSKKLSLGEIKKIVKEEFEDIKDVEEVEAEELENGWGDAELENEIEWMKTLSIKEFYKKDKK